MSKLIYLLWPRADMPPARRRELLLEDCAPAMLALNPAGLQINIADDLATVPSPAPRPLFSEPFVGMISLWLDDPGQRHGHEDVLRRAGFQLAGYQVDEWLYTEYGEHPTAGAPRDWPDGERSPGILAVTLLHKPKRLDRATWMQRWFAWQSPMSEWMQPRARYVRNLVEDTLTPGADWVDGIVEEDWPSGDHVTNPKLFYGASSWGGVARHMAIMLHSVTRILNLFNITTVMLSEYFIKTPPARN